LQGAPYVGRMEFVPKRDDAHDDATEEAPSDESTRMSGWRWLLFIAMSRFEISEEKYLRIPNAKTVRRSVPVQPEPKPAEPTQSAIE
jgi:hypothetical protein